MTNPKPGAATDVGARLREAREARDLSLRLVADRTHISVMALEALEATTLARANERLRELVARPRAWSILLPKDVG